MKFSFDTDNISLTKVKTSIGRSIEAVKRSLMPQVYKDLQEMTEQRDALVTTLEGFTEDRKGSDQDAGSGD